MRVHVIREHATESEIQDMLECLGDYINLAVDVERGVLAGGGGYHADCETALLEDGSRQDVVWGADWYPESRTVECVALINIRPRKGNLSMEVESPNLRERISAIVRRLLE
jgi:hypothetical protein